MNRIAGRSMIVFLLILVLLAGIAFFVCEFVTEANTWVIKPGSPHVYNGQSLDSGIVTDRSGILLLDLQNNKSYSANSLLRRAMVHWVGDRSGNVAAPALSAYSASMVGFDLMDGMYTYGASDGGVITTTLSASVQMTALEAMGDYKGTVAVYNYRTGELLCAVSTTTFDPDNPPDLSGGVEDAYEGIYMNRFTQSSYIPGSIFKIVTLAAALETIPDIQSRNFVCTGSCKIGDNEIICEGSHWDQSLKMAFRNSCNCAFAQIALELGSETLDRFAKQFGITEPITFDGITTASGNFEVLDVEDVNVAWSAIGQYKDLSNPCAFLTFVGAVANGGKGVNPYYVKSVSVKDTPIYTVQTNERDRVISETTAKTVAEYMQFNVEDKYGSENFPGMTVCAKTGTAEVGGEKKPNAMLTGFVRDEKYPLAFIVCVEDAGYGKTVCIPIASKVLAACKTELDS